jgi:hypothetical protein
LTWIDKIDRQIDRFWMFDDRVLRKIFGPQREDVTRGWGKFSNEELHNL